MSQDDARPEEGGHEPLGSVGEEAAKLFSALQDWARDSVGEEHRHSEAGGADCAWCPVCRAAHVLRQTNPEVRAHLGAAASHLLQAAAGLLASQPPTRPHAGVQRIDLGESTSEDESTWDAD